MFTLVEEYTGVRIKDLSFGPVNVPQAQDIITIGNDDYRVLRRHLICSGTGVLMEKHLIVERA